MPRVIALVTSLTFGVAPAVATDENGHYEVNELGPSAYTVQFFYGELNAKNSATVTEGAVSVVDGEIDTENINLSNNSVTKIPLCNHKPRNYRGLLCYP